MFQKSFCHFFRFNFLKFLFKLNIIIKVVALKLNYNETSVFLFNKKKFLLCFEKSFFLTIESTSKRNSNHNKTGQFTGFNLVFSFRAKKVSFLCFLFLFAKKSEKKSFCTKKRAPNNNLLNK